MYKKRIITVLLCAAALGFLVPGGVFAGGKGDSGDSGSKKAPPSRTPSETAVPVETSLQNSGTEVAWVQIDPKKKREVIMLGQVKAQVEQYERTIQRQLTEKERIDMLNGMVNNALVLQGAEQDNITFSNGELDQYISQMKNQLVQVLGRQPTDAEFAQAIKNEFGLDEAAFREQLRKEMITRKYLEIKKEALLKSVAIPTEADIRKYFNNAQNEFKRAQTVGISMIVVPFGSTDAAAKQQAKAIADKLNQSINATPSRFDEMYQKGIVARNNNTTIEYVAVSGHLARTTISQEQMGTEFVEAAFRLKQGSVSQVIEGRQGYHIIKVTEELVAKDLELDDPIEVGTNVTVRDFIGNRLLRQNQLDILKQATEELIAELRAKNGGGAFKIYEDRLKW